MGQQFGEIYVPWVNAQERAKKVKKQQKTRKSRFPRKHQKTPFFPTEGGGG